MAPEGPRKRADATAGAKKICLFVTSIVTTRYRNNDTIGPS